jgi:hypothetical protein
MRAKQQLSIKLILITTCKHSNRKKHEEVTKIGHYKHFLKTAPIGTTGWVVWKIVGPVHANLLCGQSASVRTADYHGGKWYNSISDFIGPRAVTPEGERVNPDTQIINSASTQSSFKFTSSRHWPSNTPSKIMYIPVPYNCSYHYQYCIQKNYNRLVSATW